MTSTVKNFGVFSCSFNWLGRWGCRRAPSCGKRVPVNPSLSWLDPAFGPDQSKAAWNLEIKVIGHILTNTFPFPVTWRTLMIIRKVYDAVCSYYRQKDVWICDLESFRCWFEISFRDGATVVCAVQIRVNDNFIRLLCFKIFKKSFHSHWISLEIKSLKYCVCISFSCMSVWKYYNCAEHFDDAFFTSKTIWQ